MKLNAPVLRGGREGPLVPRLPGLWTGFTHLKARVRRGARILESRRGNTRNPPAASRYHVVGLDSGGALSLIP